jgi:hypothetical protein
VPGLDAAVARKALAHLTYDARITSQTVAAWEDNVKTLVEQKKLKASLPWQQGARLLPVEIKAAARVTPDDAKGLEAFLDEYHDLCPRRLASEGMYPSLGIGADQSAQ